jgi:hypothetical protein
VTERKKTKPPTFVKKNTDDSKKIPFDNMKSLMDEIEHLKRYCKDLKGTMEENCIMGNERKNFEKMKNEHIKLIADFNIVKEDMQEMLTNYHNLSKRMSILEEENRHLRTHNKNLVKYVSKGENFEYEDRDYRAEYDYRPEYTNDIANYNSTVHNISSVEMNHIIQNNQDRTTNRGRFLIPKGNY